MVAPKFAYASPIGQTSIRAVFDRPMRDLGPGSPFDPVNASLWTPGGGLPAIDSVTRNSLVEFEVFLAGPAPLGTGYTLTIADTVQSTKGEVINPAFLTQTFDVTVPDLVVEAIDWVTPSSFDMVFSASLQSIAYDKYSEVLIVQPTNGGRAATVIGLEQSGALLRVTLNVPGTAGAAYSVALVRDLFVAQGTNVVLKGGEQLQTIWGQGSFGALASASATQTSFLATFSEPLNFGPIDPKPGLPLFPGVYAVSSGSLGATVATGATPSIVSFPEARFSTGDAVQWSVARTGRVVTAGQSFLMASSSFTGSGSETVLSGASTTLNKLSGVPYEVVFSGGIDSLVRTGRRLVTTMVFSFPSSAVSYPLVAFTLLNTQTSVVFSKTVDDQVTVRIYRGANPIGEESASFDASFPFDFEIIDAASDTNGFFAVSIDGEVIAGADSGDIVDALLVDQNAGVAAVAVTLGSPAFASETFSVSFMADLSVSAFLTTGLRGQNSRDLLSFSGSETTVVVAASPTPADSPGFQSTGKAAFGVHAEYMEAVDAIQVVVGLNQGTSIPEFTGTISLLTGQKDVIDQVQVDQSTVLVGDNEVIAVFLHPKSWSGIQVGVAFDIAGSTYSVIVPVLVVGQAPITGQLTQQPASWYHQRLPLYPASVSAYGPATVIS